MSTDVNVPEWKEKPDCEGLWASIRRTPTGWNTQAGRKGPISWLDADMEYVTEEELASVPWNTNDYVFFGPIPPPLTTQEDHK